jgi:DNA-binding NtrC family response regulator
MSQYILIVDYVISVRHGCKMLLDSQNFESKEASDGKEALEIAKQEKPALVISDYFMPNLNGSGLYHELLKIYPDIKFVLMTGSLSDIENPDEFPQILSKPFSMDSLISMVKENLDTVNPTANPTPIVQTVPAKS